MSTKSAKKDMARESPAIFADVKPGFSAQRFLKEFGHLAGAPGGIEKLRELVLQLALQGQQVQLKSLEPEFLNGVSSRGSVNGVPTTVLRLADIRNGNINLQDQRVLNLPEGSQDKYALKENDFLIIRVNGSADIVGRLILASENLEGIVYCDHFIRMRVSEQRCLPRYLRIIGDSRFVREQIQSAFLTTAGQKTVNQKHIESLQIPLPPLAEQERIVAKVDELMGLCDGLAARQDARNTCRVQLHSAALHALTTAPDNAALKPHWRRIHDHFDLLHSTPDAIPRLRQTILQLAVQGKLVPQDPNDEPAEKLLERIAEFKSKLGYPTTENSLQPEPQGPVVPKGWARVTLGNIVINRDSERIPVSREERSQQQGMYDYYGASGVIDKVNSYLFDKPLLLVGEDGANLLRRSTPIAFMARGKYWVNNHAHVLDSISEAVLLYIALFINAIDLAPYVTGTAQPKMNQAKMHSIPVLIPPLAEQKRIVAKVDELMGLCDALEAKLSASQSAQQALLTAIVRRIA